MLGAQVLDGAGGPPRRADVGIRGSVIEAVGDLGGAPAAESRRFEGCYLVPGLVDAHAHTDAVLGDPEVQLATLRQGVTTMVLGQDGVSIAPSDAATAAYVANYFGPISGPWPAPLAGGASTSELLEHWDRRTPVNIGYLVPLGTVRHMVKGASDLPASAEELRAMRSLVEEALDAGAVGASSGLEYVPGCFAGPEELAALCEPMRSNGGVYVSHLRGYEDRIGEGLGEAGKIATSAGVPLHVSHLRSRAATALELVERIASRGADVSYDTYPYLPGSTILAMKVLPAQLQRSGLDETLDALAEPTTRAWLEGAWMDSMEPVVDRLTFASIDTPAHRWMEGLRPRAAAARAGCSVGRLLCDLLAETRLQVGCLTDATPAITEGDVRELALTAAHMVGSDGIFRGGHPHPRAFGAFARHLAALSRGDHGWSWPDAVAHLSTRAADRFGFAGRGRLVPGSAADVVALDPGALADRADFATPRALAEGVRDVVVNGQTVLRSGRLTGATPGRALRRGLR